MVDWAVCSLCLPEGSISKQSGSVGCCQADAEDTHQPDEAPQDEVEHVTDLDAQLAGGCDNDSMGALCPADAWLLDL